MQPSRILQYLSTTKTCASRQAKKDFAAFVGGSKRDKRLLLRMAQHTRRCRSCQVLIATLVMLNGLRRTLHAGAFELLGSPYEEPGIRELLGYLQPDV